MARAPAIGIADVEKAKNALLSQGVTVNPYQIRQLLGRGSYDTIEKFLRALSVTSENEQQTEDRLSKSLAEMVRPLAQELTRQNNDRLSALAEQHRDQLSQLQDKNRILSDNHADLTATSDNQRQQIEMLTDQLSQQNEQCQQLGQQLQISQHRTVVIEAEQRQLLSRFNEAEQRLNQSREDHRHQLADLNQQHRETMTAEQVKTQGLQRQCDLKEQRISDELNKSLLLAERVAELSGDIGAINSELAEYKTKLEHQVSELAQANSLHTKALTKITDESQKLIDEIKHDHHLAIDELKANQLAHLTSVNQRVDDFRQQKAEFSLERSQLQQTITALQRRTDIGAE
jgi:DNA repair exonuclease SbcCD ATPase subunit